MFRSREFIEMEKNVTISKISLTKNNLSRCLEPKFLAVIFGGISTASILYFTYKYIKKRRENTPPSKWKKVGELSEILCYPIKSCGGICLNEISSNELDYWNRSFKIVHTSDGKIISKSNFPKLLAINPKLEIENNLMIVEASGMIDLKIELAPLRNAKAWKHDVGENAAIWFSRYILHENSGIRLIFQPSDCSNISANFILVNESSLLKENNFGLGSRRPNFIVKNAKKHDEENWKWIKFGTESIFRKIKSRRNGNVQFINLEEQESPAESPTELQKWPCLTVGIPLKLNYNGVMKMNDVVFIQDS